MSTLRGFVWRAWDPADDDEHGTNAWTAATHAGGLRLFGVACGANPTATYHESRAEAFAAVEIALFDANYPNCCHWCGWSLSSHGHSLYGLDCPPSTSPANKAGHVLRVRRAMEVVR